MGGMDLAEEEREAIGSLCPFPSPCNTGQIWGQLISPWGVLKWTCPYFGAWSLFSEEERHRSNRQPWGQPGCAASATGTLFSKLWSHGTGQLPGHGL